MREQEDGWDEHARFMDDLVDKGSIIPGGPLEGDRETICTSSRPSRSRPCVTCSRPIPGGSMACSVPCASSAGTIVLDGRG